MKIISDLQIHSKFARAVSSQMIPSVISQWARIKGIDLVATGDWTHPLWFRELSESLVETSEGIYKLKENQNKKGEPSFLLSTEVSSIYKQGDKLRRIHILIFAPNLEVAGKINQKFVERGVNLVSDGRPIMGLKAAQIAELVLQVDERALVIPAHAWTPHFSLFGSLSGFDSIEECFGDYSKYIYAIETGLSSDPAMNWRVPELANRQIVSFSDAHSPSKLGREATVFDLEELTFKNLRNAIVSNKNKDKIDYTIEFYPEEGKYHYTGHRNCNVVLSPKDAKKRGNKCPVCGKTLTVGVMSRVEDLARDDIEIETSLDDLGVRWFNDKKGIRPRYLMTVPLVEIIAEAVGVGVASKKVQELYRNMTLNLGPEFKILLLTSLGEIEKNAGAKVATAIARVRRGDIYIEPGYDGIFGKVRVWKEEEKVKVDQSTLF